MSTFSINFPQMAFVVNECYTNQTELNYTPPPYASHEDGLMSSLSASTNQCVCIRW